LQKKELKLEKKVEKLEKKSNPGAARKAMKAAGNALEGMGAKVGNMILPGIGGHLGHAAEGLFKTLLGFGDYSEVENINQPEPMNNTIMGLQTPTVTHAVENMHWNGQVTRVAHREYIGSISMTAGFACASYAIDPTSTFMFPWLSTLAKNFQKWKLLGCVFEYVPTSTNAISGGSPAVGQVCLSILYDIEGPPSTSLQNLLNNQGSVSARPQDQMVCAVECDPGETPLNPLYIAHPGTSVFEPHFYEFADLQIATQGPAAYSDAGQLWVTYDVQLIAAYVEVPPSPTPIQKVVITNGDGERKESDDHVVITSKPAPGYKMRSQQ
jgi:hypothetical protein